MAMTRKHHYAVKDQDILFVEGGFALQMGT